MRPETGYVAEVRYEGTPVFAEALIAAPSSERLTQVRAPKELRPQGRPQPSGRQNQRIDQNSANSTPQVEQQSIPAFFTA